MTNIIILNSCSLLNNRTICNLIFLSWCWQIKRSIKTDREKHSQLWAAILKLTKKTNNILGQFVIFCVKMSIFVTIRMIYLGWDDYMVKYEDDFQRMNLYEREDERLKDSGMFGQLWSFIILEEQQPSFSLIWSFIPVSLVVCLFVSVFMLQKYQSIDWLDLHWQVKVK